MWKHTEASQNSFYIGQGSKWSQQIIGGTMPQLDMLCYYEKPSEPGMACIPLNYWSKG